MDLMAEFQIAPTIDAFSVLDLDNTPSTKLVIQWSIASVTSDTELAALRHLTEQKRIGERKPAERSIQAFRTLLNFNRTDKTFVNLHEAFPHLAHPSDPKHKIRYRLLDKYRSFNDDHLAAYNGLTNYADGLYFLQGCPGAGKTEFNMVLTALIQSCRREKSRRQRSPVLFLVDINKTVDDAANRYFQLCQDVGLVGNRRPRIIRMHGFPYEFRNSGTIQKASQKQEKTQTTTLDFTKSFLTTSNLVSRSGLPASPKNAPTLDEAAWVYYDSHKEADCFHSITKFLQKLATPDALSSSDWKDLRNAVTKLYVAVLVQADFIATTPVAASGSFSKLFRPEVIIVDEAPHARELTTLVPIAYFDPLLWLFTGDTRQTQPFVKGGTKGEMESQGLRFNPYQDQLRLSTMARAAAVGALNGKLFVNKRAHGNLHRLPSALFYGDEMRSGHTSYSCMYPESTAYLRGYLARLGGIDKAQLKENRIIVQLENSCERQRRSTSYWNPVHHNWVLKQAKALLSDPYFQSLNHGPGTIMIQSPYKSATREYEAEVKRWPSDWRDRIEVLTVDKAQGNQADVVILDMVRSTTVGFMDNPQRLNVAITRAKQAEIIVMHQAMTRRLHSGTAAHTLYMSKLWDDTAVNGRLILVGGPKENARPLRERDPNTEARSLMQPESMKGGVSVSC